MSLSSNFPTIKPSLNLDFANVGRLDPRVTFTRASTATYYDGVTTAKAEENLLTYSQEFDNAIWGKDNGSVSSNTTAAPDGTTTADTFTENSANDIHRLNFGGTGAPAGIVTCSVFVKAGAGTRYPTVGIASGNAAYASATFDLSTGTNTQTLSAGYSGVSASIQNTGGGWYRCVLTATTTATANFYVALSDSSTFVNGFRGAQVYTGDNTSTLIFWGAQLEQRSSVTAYTATTTQAITNYVPVLLTAQNDVPRFDHNPTTGAALGLLIEEQRTNSVTYSADFGNAAWTTLNTGITQNTNIAPDGTISADTVTASAATGAHEIYNTISGNSVIGTAYTMSVFAKAGTNSFIQLFFSVLGFGSNAFANFNLSTGALGTIGSSATATIISVGNGWYRCTMTATATGASTYYHDISVVNSASAARNLSWTAAGTETVFIWGAQLEAGAFATSYIPTTTTALTRNADVASMTGTNFSSWFNAAEGTLYSSVITQKPASNSATVFGPTLDNQSTANFITSTRFSSNSLTARVDDTSIAQVSATLVFPYVENTLYKTAIAYKQNDFAYTANGATPGTDATGTVPSISRLAVGFIGTVLYLNGHIQRIAYYPTRLTNAQLQALTG